MRRNESGRITLKAILSLAFLAAVVYTAVKVIPVYINNYELQDYVETQTPFWLTQRASSEAIVKNIMAKSNDLGLPITADNITVEANLNRVDVNIDYHVPVDLKVCTLPLHFTVSKGNTAIQ
jgi:hypothetical protein